MTTARIRTAFVPHDLKAPIAGATSGPLHGLTVVIKDMYDIAGERTGGGNPDWLAAHEPATRNAMLVQKLLDAGATITGKTVCDEFFYSIAGVNAHYGTPVNPRAPGRLPGGSSSGSASAAASDACDFAIGSDTGGSVRIPSSFCGLYGIRTTHENGYQRWLATDYAGMGTFRGDSHPDDNSEADKAALLAQNLADGYDPTEVFAVYHLVLPAGMTAPVPHTPRAGGPQLTVADKLNHLVFGDPLPTNEANQ